MNDELETLRALRSHVDPPGADIRNAARARWDREPLELTPAHPLRGARAFTVRTAIAAVVAVTVVAGAWFVTRQRINSVKPTHILSVTSLPIVPATDPQVFLLVGSDSRAFVQSPGQAQAFGDPGAIGGERSDTIILVRIEPADRRALMVSIPRDLTVDVPGCGPTKINATFNAAFVCGDAHGGAQLLVRTITESLGVPVNHVITVDFPQFASLVDQVGGLRVNFPFPTRDTYTGLSEPAGCTTLDGNAALAFVRSRHYEYSVRDGQWQSDPASDLGRVQRQRLALGQLATAAETRSGSDPRPLLRALFANVSVDPGFTADDALRYFTALRGDHAVVTLTLPVRAGPDDSSLVLDDGAPATLKALAGNGEPAPLQPGHVASSPPAATPTPC